ncbi:MAG: M15 family metallopeptidase [Eubacteriaceae bacterium]|nr:M15 family metallopeptidase [Eubacteriaceae bacterium]
MKKKKLSKPSAKRRKKRNNASYIVILSLLFMAIMAGVWIHQTLEGDLGNNAAANIGADYSSAQEHLMSNSALIANIEHIEIIALNNTDSALEGSVLSFVAVIYGTGSRGEPVEPFRTSEVTIEPSFYLPNLQPGSVVIPASGGLPGTIEVLVGYYGIRKAFTYTIKRQDYTSLGPSALVNKYTSKLDINARPAMTTNVNGKEIEARAGEALMQMIADAKDEGVKMYLSSGFRSFSLQSSLYDRAVASSGANQNASAPPGHSEHQLGYAADLTCNEIVEGHLTVEFEQTQAFKWLLANSHRYGYILRYTRENIALTEYMYEPWHFRYIGEELAFQYVNEGWRSLEEFLSIPREAF